MHRSIVTRPIRTAPLGRDRHGARRRDRGDGRLPFRLGPELPGAIETNVLAGARPGAGSRAASPAPSCSSSASAWSSPMRRGFRLRGFPAPARQIGGGGPARDRRDLFRLSRQLHLLRHPALHRAVERAGPALPARCPSALALAVAAFVFAAPWFFTDPVLRRTVARLARARRRRAVTNDYVPVFPWFALVLLGLVVAKLACRRLGAPAGARGGLARSQRPSSGRAGTACRSTCCTSSCCSALLYGVLQSRLGPNPAPRLGPSLRNARPTGVRAQAQLPRDLRLRRRHSVRRSVARPLADDLPADAATPASALDEATQQCLRQRSRAQP